MTTTRPRPHNTSCPRVQHIDHSLATRDRNSASYSSTNTRRKTLPVGDFGICVQTFAINDPTQFFRRVLDGTDLLDDGDTAPQPFIPTERVADPRVKSHSDLGRTERPAAWRQNDPRPRDAFVRRTSAAHTSNGHIDDQTLGMPEQRLLDLCRGHLHSRNFQRVLSPIAWSDRVSDPMTFIYAHLGSICKADAGRRPVRIFYS